MYDHFKARFGFNKFYPLYLLFKSIKNIKIITNTLPNYI
jgi:hypothetical protein